MYDIHISIENYVWGVSDTLYVNACVGIYVYIYIYIYIERDRERERDVCVSTCICCLILT